ncbi:AraC family transcriptional regulator ligand-binding domain-containing protein [Maricurvus nonylphenolicus]|uniref:AraC family transcriptional regulator n=1 Tax=Maricurvus nonylphenolicus TaxID=1008307 RepID=UPI0036F35D1C
MSLDEDSLLIPASYSRIIARELNLQERELEPLLRGTGLPINILLPGDEAYITAQQQMRVLDNAQHILGSPEIGLRLGRQLQPSSHGPLGYLVLSSPDVITALESFADFLPLRLPLASVQVDLDEHYLTCILEIRVSAKPNVLRIMQECFALMIQAVVESVLGRELTEASIELQHARPSHSDCYGDYLHSAVHFSQTVNRVQMPAVLARKANASGHSDSYSLSQDHCCRLLEQIPVSAMSTTDQVRRLLLSHPAGSITEADVAREMFVSKRTLARRLAEEGSSYRTISEKLLSELAVRHLRESNFSIDAVAASLGYCDAAAFRKAFRRWYGQTPSQYRRDKLLMPIS